MERLIISTRKISTAGMVQEDEWRMIDLDVKSISATTSFKLSFQLLLHNAAIAYQIGKVML
jgi:hypothetical protein